MYTTVHMKPTNTTVLRASLTVFVLYRGLQRCRLSLLTNSVLVYESKCGGGGSCGVSANEYSCAHHVTWSPIKLWRSISIFNLWFYTSSPIQELILNNNKISRVTDIRQVERHRPIFNKE